MMGVPVCGLGDGNGGVSPRGNEKGFVESFYNFCDQDREDLP